MSQENDSRFAIIATLVAFGLVGGVSLLLWALTGRVDNAVQLQSDSSSITLNDDLSETVRSRVSMGAQLLFDAESEQKQAGIDAIAEGD